MCAELRGACEIFKVRISRHISSKHWLDILCRVFNITKTEAISRVVGSLELKT